MREEEVAAEKKTGSSKRESKVTRNDKGEREQAKGEMNKEKNKREQENGKKK